MEQPQIKEFLTYADVVRSGACLDGVIEACKEHGTWFGKTDDLLQVFGTDNGYLTHAAGINGYGYGYGYGYGNGNGNGDGDGNGYGDGYGYGYGDGYGNGSGDGYGNGSGDGDGGM